ncbi:hypothetical protein C1G87_1477 [Dehalococcoides mccartyi]|uniref:Uncharacterized protein n=1 Tax=Dehalococcoides mccartyi TaxID=61435 RepID=A0A142VBT7_9CHLR|nr:hypothetical protein Dm11a5_1474 [Dehalococcoides mccartyi]RAL68992.1 hypothetical protein C1G87_1477 [Dehalococcoides mccartyi]
MSAGHIHCTLGTLKPLLNARYQFTPPSMSIVRIIMFVS